MNVCREQESEGCVREVEVTWKLLAGKIFKDIFVESFCMNSKILHMLGPKLVTGTIFRSSIFFFYFSVSITCCLRFVVSVGYRFKHFSSFLKTPSTCFWVPIILSSSDKKKKRWRGALENLFLTASLCTVSPLACLLGGSATLSAVQNLWLWSESRLLDPQTGNLQRCCLSD